MLERPDATPDMAAWLDLIRAFLRRLPGKDKAPPPGAIYRPIEYPRTFETRHTGGVDRAPHENDPPPTLGRKVHPYHPPGSAPRRTSPAARTAVSPRHPSINRVPPGTGNPTRPGGGTRPFNPRGPGIGKPSGTGGTSGGGGVGSPPPTTTKSTRTGATGGSNFASRPPTTQAKFTEASGGTIGSSQSAAAATFSTPPPTVGAPSGFGNFGIEDVLQAVGTDSVALAVAVSSLYTNSSSSSSGQGGIVIGQGQLANQPYSDTFANRILERVWSDLNTTFSEDTGVLTTQANGVLVYNPHTIADGSIGMVFNGSMATIGNGAYIALRAGWALNGGNLIPNSGYGLQFFLTGGSMSGLRIVDLATLAVLATRTTLGNIVVPGDLVVFSSAGTALSVTINAVAVAALAITDATYASGNALIYAPVACTLGATTITPA